MESEASMRPRVFPAEDPGAVSSPCGCRSASMRPRVFPAEDSVSLTNARQVESLQ